MAAEPQKIDPFAQAPNGAVEALHPVLVLDPSVVEGYCLCLHRALVGLASQGFSAGVIAPPQLDLSALVCPTAQVFECPAWRMVFLRRLGEQLLLERLARFRPSLLHTFYPGPVKMAHRLAVALKLPLVITFHGVPRRRFSAANTAAALIAPNPTIAAGLAQVFPDLRSRQTVAPVGSYADETPACFSHGTPCVSMMVIEPFDHLRTFEPLLSAVRHLLLDGLELMLVLMGHGRAEPAIRHLIRQLGLSRAVTIVPPMRSLRAMLQGADIFVHLKDRGLFNVHLLEAFAVGLAVAGMADNSTGLMADGQTAAVWKANDEISIYTLLKRLTLQRDYARQLAQSAQDHIRQHLSVWTMVERLGQIYRQVCAGIPLTY